MTRLLILTPLTAIQLAKLSGFSPIITTVSLRNVDYVKSLGATHAIDRSLPLADLGANVAAITKEPIKVIFDCVGNADTQNAAYELVAPGGVFLTALGIQVNNPVEDKEIFAPYGSPHPASHRAFGVELWAHASELLAKGEFKVSFLVYDLSVASKSAEARFPFT